MPEIKPIVRKEVVSAPPTTIITELAELMADENIGSIVIVHRRVRVAVTFKPTRGHSFVVLRRLRPLEPS